MHPVSIFKILTFAVFFMAQWWSSPVNAQTTEDWLWSRAGGGVDVLSAIYEPPVVTRGNAIVVAGVFRAGAHTPMIFDSSALQLFPSAGFRTTAFLAQYAAEGDLNWAKGFEGGEVLEGKVAVDRDDNIYFAGRVEDYIQVDTVRLVPANVDDPFLFLIKLDNEGTLIWAKILAETEPVTVPGEVHYLGLESIKVDPHGDVLLLGDFEQPSVSFRGAVVTQAGFRDIFLAKLDGEGNLIWAKGKGDAALHDFAQQLALDMKANIYIARTFQPTGVITDPIKTMIDQFDPVGNVLWTDTIDPGQHPNGLAYMQMDVGPDNYLYTMAAYRGSFSIGNHVLEPGNHIVISKVAPDGTYDWVRTTGSTSISDPTIFPRGIACDDGGAVYITGTYVEGLTGLVTDLILDTVQLINQGGRDGFLAKFDREGTLQYAHNVGGLLDDGISGLALDGNQQVYLPGYFNSPELRFNELIQLNPSANSHTWSTNFFLAKFGEGRAAGIAEEGAHINLRLFPNPARSTLRLECDAAIQSVTLFDFQGRPVHTNAFKEVLHSATLDVRHLAAGSYYLMVSGPEGTAVRKVSLLD